MKRTSGTAAAAATDNDVAVAVELLLVSVELLASVGSLSLLEP